MSKTVNGNRTAFTWNGQNLACEVNGDSINTYTYDVTGISSAVINGVYRTYMKDTHGSVVGYYNSNGERMTQYEYDAFGNRLKGSAPDPFGYCGEYYDSESGNIYLRARYYNSTTGRFISEDPAKDGVNWYVYCSGNPVMLVDPTGLALTDDDIRAYNIGLLSPDNYNMIIEADALWSSAAEDDYATKVEARKMAVAARRTYDPSYEDNFDYTFGGKYIEGSPYGMANVGVLQQNEMPLGYAGAIVAILTLIFNTSAGETWDEIAEIQKSSAIYTPIYRYGSGTYKNLTPRPQDINGLSYTLIKPDKGPYTVTTIEAVNASGSLVAIKDGGNHVSVRAIYGHDEWIASRDDAENNPHPYSIFLREHSIKVK